MCDCIHVRDMIIRKTSSCMGPFSILCYLHHVCSYLSSFFWKVFIKCFGIETNRIALAAAETSTSEVIRVYTLFPQKLWLYAARVNVIASITQPLTLTHLHTCSGSIFDFIAPFFPSNVFFISTHLCRALKIYPLKNCVRHCDNKN